jgi:hypothetical protein
MSETTNTGTTERKFKSVNGKDLSNDGAEQQGELRFVRPSKLTEADRNTVVAEGIFEKTVPNKFDDKKLDYCIRGVNGDLTILNSAGSLASQMSKIELGSYVQITYAGKNVIKNGKMSGKEAHSFIVGVEDTSEDVGA